MCVPIQHSPEQVRQAHGTQCRQGMSGLWVRVRLHQYFSKQHGKDQSVLQKQRGNDATSEVIYGSIIPITLRSEG